LSKVCWMLQIQMLRCAGDQGCAGESWGPIFCFIWVAVKAGFNTSWVNSLAR